MTDKEKLEKLKKLADAMYYAAQYLTTDASRLHKAMDEYHQFIIHEYHNEEPVSEDTPFEPIGIPADAVELANIPNKKEPTISEIVDEHYWEMLGEEHVSNKMGGINNALSQDILAMKSVDEAMAEVEEKSKAFTEAHKDESSEQLLAEMRGEEPVSEDFEKIVEEIAEPTILNAYGTKELARRLRNTICYISVSEELEEAAENYAATDEVLPNGKVMINFQAEKAFRAGANWQKQKDEKVLNENALLYNARLEGIEIGKAEMKQQMMKDAIEMVAYPKYGELWGNLIRTGCKNGDKVKVIIIKGE